MRVPPPHFERSGMWDPQAPASPGEDDAISVDARPAFGQPVRVHASRAELRRLVARLKGETSQRRIAVSNDAFRKCVSARIDAETPKDDFEKFCGAVVVFYCARNVISGTPVPILASRS